MFLSLYITNPQTGKQYNWKLLQITYFSFSFDVEIYIHFLYHTCFCKSIPILVLLPPLKRNIALCETMILLLISKYTKLVDNSRNMHRIRKNRKVRLYLIFTKAEAMRKTICTRRNRLVKNNILFLSLCWNIK